jgi:hypothetical protein
VPTYDITEDVPYDISAATTAATFELTDIAYDVVIDDLPFIANVSNQNPYRRETAPYRKDQFDNSTEPGEQSLTGWWLRSQTSWHNGAGILFYEPGTDYQHVSHRFFDSRGIDIWTVGEATLLPEVFHAYTGIKGINASAGRDGLDDVLISGDNNGILKRLKLNGNSAITSDSSVNYVHTGTSYCQGHNGSNYPFTSVTTSGSKYYATCSGAIHRGDISTLNSDTVFARHSGGDTNAFVKYAKGFVFFGENNILNLLDTTQSDTNAHDGALPGGKQYDSRTHIDNEFVWNDVAAGTTHIYASGNSGNNGEIFKIGFDAAPTSANNGSLLPDLSSSTVTATLPDGETIKAIYYYLGYLAVGTNLGVRICQVTPDGDIVIGPLLLDSAYPINGFTQRGNYIYAATKVDSGADTNGILIRIDLSQQFTDGTFAYAYDLEYESSLDGDSSDCTEVYNIDNRIVMVIQENSDTIKGELQVEHTTNKRSTGWLQTGKIRYGTVEPKFFRYLNVQCTTGQGDNITVYTIDKTETVNSLAILSEGLSNQDVLMTTLENKQEYISLRFVFNNVTDDQQLPVLEAYQIKAVPATRRQRLYQYPLSCYDSEMDRFSSIFGYTGRAMEFIQRLESIEETGKFVNITDYRTGEQYQGVIEEVRFTNESSPDKNNNGFGGLLLVTVRKL